MSWDNPVHSFNFPNGEPQTPTRTPPTTIFGDSAFQTPKLESSFFDPRVTWDTSDPYASSPEFLRTPQKFGLSTPSNHPIRLPETVPEQPAEQDFLNGRSTKPVTQQTDTAKRIRASKPNGISTDDGPRTVDSAKSAASMQTPPPSSASRRKLAEFGDGGGTGTGTGRRPSSVMGAHLETPSRLMGASPRLFGDLQTSPDPFHLASIDPGASPFYPQQRLFWDNDLGQHTRDMALPDNSLNVFGSQAETFPVNHQPLHDPRISQLPSIEGSLDLPDFSHQQLYGLSSGTTTDAALFPAPFSTSPRLPATKAEDPAMFLSSPARRFGGTQPSPGKRLFSQPPRQPYHHQTEESKRELLRRTQSVHRQLPSYEDEDEEDDFTPRQVRPTLTRSLTHSALSAPRPGSGMSSSSGIRKSPSKGRLSPTKPVRQSSLSRANSVAGGMPRRSQSVILRIGKDGRAKTEMQPVPEASTGLTDPITAMDLEGSATESEYDSTEYCDYPAVGSRTPSFAFSDAGRPNLARSDSGSRPHSKGSYTSTAASSQSGRASPWGGASRAAAVRRPPYRATGDEWNRTPTKRQSMMGSDLSYRSASSIPAPRAESEEDTGDAQHALRKVLREKGRMSRPHTVNYGSRYNRPSRSLAHLQSSPPRFGGEPDFGPRDANTSPTTMTDPDLATPSFDRYSNPSNGTRCICQSMDNGGHLMIQCESCSHWLHTKCVGLERANLPSVYICVFCAQTPTRRNCVRVPMGNIGHAPTSPLAHKSYRFR